jgi:hypothetical protein
MLNQFVIVGRIKEMPYNVEENRHVLCLEVTQNYRNDGNDYAKSYIDIVLNAEMARKIENFCNIGVIIGAKGHIDTHNEYGLELRCEKITFLSSNPETIKEQSKPLIDDSGEI